MSKVNPLAALICCVVGVVACAAPASSTTPSTVPAGSSVPSTAPPAAAPSVPAPSPSPSEATNALHLVVIGDSIPFGDHFCPGCTAFPAQYAKDLETRLGRPVVLQNRSRDDGAQMDDIEVQVKGSGPLRAELEAADVVLVSVGFNNAFPDPATWHDCKGDIGGSVESYVDWALSDGSACLKPGLATYAKQYDRIFSMLTDLRKGKPTVFGVINVHDGNLNGSDFTDAGMPAAKLAAINAWMVGVYDRWNAMECDRGKAHGFACVDVYHAFNGPKGDQPSGTVNTIDGAHPSQAGNDLIAGLLSKLDISAISK